MMPKPIILVAVVLFTLALLVGGLTLLRSASQNNPADPVASQLHKQAETMRILATELQQPASANPLSRNLAQE